jgi:hypothetical protein
MGNKLFIVILFRDYNKETISYVGLFHTKQAIIQSIPILSYNDLVPKQNKYKTIKSLFHFIEIPNERKHYFNSYHLTKDKRQIIPQGF